MLGLRQLKPSLPKDFVVIQVVRLVTQISILQCCYTFLRYGGRLLTLPRLILFAKASARVNASVRVIGLAGRGNLKKRNKWKWSLFHVITARNICLRTSKLSLTSMTEGLQAMLNGRTGEWCSVVNCGSWERLVCASRSCVNNITSKSVKADSYLSCLVYVPTRCVCKVIFQSLEYGYIWAGWV